MENLQDFELIIPNVKYRTGNLIKFVNKPLELRDFCFITTASVLVNNDNEVYSKIDEIVNEITTGPVTFIRPYMEEICELNTHDGDYNEKNLSLSEFNELQMAIMNTVPKNWLCNILKTLIIMFIKKNIEVKDLVDSYHNIKFPILKDRISKLMKEIEFGKYNINMTLSNNEVLSLKQLLNYMANAQPSWFTNNKIDFIKSSENEINDNGDIRLIERMLAIVNITAVTYKKFSYRNIITEMPLFSEPSGYDTEDEETLNLRAINNIDDMVIDVDENQRASELREGQPHTFLFDNSINKQPLLLFENPKNKQILVHYLF
jgi:hypothetical protein